MSQSATTGCGLDGDASQPGRDAWLVNIVLEEVRRVWRRVDNATSCRNSDSFDNVALVPHARPTRWLVHRVAQRRLAALTSTAAVACLGVGSCWLA